MRSSRRNLKQIARTLRAHMTESEQVLWSRLRGNQLRFIQFYRQKPIGDAIVNFYAPKAKLVVEVDGSQHLDRGGYPKRCEAKRFLGTTRIPPLALY